MSAPLALGLIGCGRVAERFYLPALGRLPDLRLAVVADPLPERRRLASGLFPGVREFASGEELLEEGKLDAVLVATPAETHAGLTALALRAGVAALVEKPLATTASEAEELGSLARESGAPLMMGFNRRWWEPVRRLRRAVLEGGNPETCSARLVCIGELRSWSPIAQPADALGDLAPHQFDLLRHLFGRDILTVEAVWTDADAVRMRVWLAGGLVAECLVAHQSGYRERVSVERDARRYGVRSGSERITPAGGPARAALDFSDAVLRRLRRRPSSLRVSFERQLAAFAECVRAGSRPEPGIEDGVAAARAVDAARESASRGGTGVAV